MRVATVRLVKARPPDAVAAAFLDVASAREDRETYINEANAYANEVVPRRGARRRRPSKRPMPSRPPRSTVPPAKPSALPSGTMACDAARNYRDAPLPRVVEKALAKVRKYVISPDLKGSNLDFWLWGQGSPLPPFIPSSPSPSPSMPSSPPASIQRRDPQDLDLSWTLYWRIIMPRTRVILLIALAVAFLAANLVFFTVDETQFAVVTQFGEPIRAITAPGLGWKFPEPVQSVQFFNKRCARLQRRQDRILTSDKKNVVIESYVAGKSPTPSCI